MLRCLFDAIDIYEDDEWELHDKLHDKFPQLSEKAFEVLYSPKNRMIRGLKTKNKDFVGKE